jgi:hypothetical protein
MSNKTLAHMFDNSVPNSDIGDVAFCIDPQGIYIVLISPNPYGYYFIIQISDDIHIFRFTTQENQIDYLEEFDIINFTIPSEDYVNRCFNIFENSNIPSRINSFN